MPRHGHTKQGRNQTGVHGFAGNDGAVGITAVSPAWLPFDWDAGSPGLENAIGTARFGVYKGNGRLIYQRETF